MKLEATTVQMLFAAVEVVFGLVGFLTGKITFGVGEAGSSDSGSDTEIIGSPAKVLSGALIVTGIVTFFHATSGYTLLVVTLVAGYIFSRRAGV